MQVEIPAALDFLFYPKRYKVPYGGRGSGKSWGVARALLILGTQRPLRILCTREIQKSLKDSVFKLLCDQIEHLRLGQYYHTTQESIKGINGTEFFFSGLASHTVESIKSFEGVDICWVEEGQTVCKKSWDILAPTIRKSGSEIWVTFNPSLDTDETYVRFVINTPPDCIVKLINYNDNPYFSKELEQERLHCLATNPEDYENIWLGKCRSSVSGAIYSQEVGAMYDQNRITNLPYDPRLKVHTIWDLGWNDATAIILCQVLRSEIRIIEYIEDTHKTLDYYAAELNARRLNYAYDYLPHDGFYRDFKTGMSAEEILKRFGRNVKATPNIKVEDGIRMTRQILNRCVFDKEHSSRLVECLKRYRRAINEKTGVSTSPVHDEYSHGADAMRYLAINANSLKNEENFRRSRPITPKILDPVAGY